MAVDNYGFIILPDFREFQAAFSQLVTDVVQTLTTTFPGLIHSVYVYGSLIDATAIERLSDLDLTSLEPRRFLASTCLFCPVGCLVNGIFISGT